MEDQAATFRKQSITAARAVPAVNEERAFRVKVPRSIGSIPSCSLADIEAAKVGQSSTDSCTTFLLAYQFPFRACGIPR